MSIFNGVCVGLWILFGILLILKLWVKEQSPAPRGEGMYWSVLLLVLVLVAAMALMSNIHYEITAVLLLIVWTGEWIAERMWVRRMRGEGGWIKSSPFAPYRYGIGKDGVPLPGYFSVGHFVSAKVEGRMILGATDGAYADVGILVRQLDTDISPKKFYRTISDLKLELWKRYPTISEQQAQDLPTQKWETPLELMDLVFYSIDYQPAPKKIR